MIFLSPSKLFGFVNILLRVISKIILPLIIISLMSALLLSPQDYIQGNSVRIMYIHVPSAWISLACFAVIALLSIVNFLFKIKNTFLIYKSLAPIGLLFSIITIVTGSIWGKPTWGTWWVWDARLTSVLVLTLFYIAFILSYKFISNEEKSIKVCTSISILGLINLFIIKYSVDWWATLHQPSSIKFNGETSIHGSMLAPLFLMLFTFLLYCGLIFLMKYKTEIIRIKKKGLKRL